MVITTFPVLSGTTWGTWARPFHGDSKGERASNNISHNSPLMKPSDMAEPRDTEGGHCKVTWQGAWVQERASGASEGRGEALPQATCFGSLP